MDRLISLLGILFVFALAYLASRNRQAIRWKYVALGIGLQLLFAIAILGIPFAHIPGVLRFAFDGLNWSVTRVIAYTNAGSQFIFGPLAENKDPWGFIFAFRVLPTIIFFSSVMSGLYHLGVLQRVVRVVAVVMQKTLKTSGAETLSAAGNMFMGQTEAPLMIRPFIAKMTNSEMFCVMVGGMSTLAAGVEAAYISLLHDRLADIAGHLITASVMGAIGGLVISKIIYPETETPVTAGSLRFEVDQQKATNVVEAISRGASDGIMLALNVAAMLIAFVALISILNAVLGKIGFWLHLETALSLTGFFGFLCRPLAWLFGVPWSEAATVGRVLGEKIVMNEFVGYVDLSKSAGQLSDRTVLIASYALCGFANFSSIGIQIGGIGGMAPNQKPTMAKLGFLAVLGGNLACFLSACIAGLLF